MEKSGNVQENWRWPGKYVPDTDYTLVLDFFTQYLSQTAIAVCSIRNFIICNSYFSCSFLYRLKNTLQSLQGKRSNFVMEKSV